MSGGTEAERSRAERLAQALRANLKRRKAQQRGRAAAAAEGSDAPEGPAAPEPQG